MKKLNTGEIFLLISIMFLTTIFVFIEIKDNGLY